MRKLRPKKVKSQQRIGTRALSPNFHPRDLFSEHRLPNSFYGHLQFGSLLTSEETFAGNSLRGPQNSGIMDSLQSLRASKGRETDPNIIRYLRCFKLLGPAHNSRIYQSYCQCITTHIMVKFSAMNMYYFYNKKAACYQNITSDNNICLTSLYSLQRLFRLLFIIFSQNL